LPDFTSASLQLILGKASVAIKEQRTCAVQTISGTGANHLGGLFLHRQYGPWQKGAPKVIYLSNPTWANHKAIFNNLGIETQEYPYYDPKTIGLDYQGFLSAIESAPEASVFLVHACAHNPTGVDPTRDQWQNLAQAFLKKGHFVFFDCAYQGFASGDLDNDAWAVRHFVDQKIPLLICQSFAKNAGLYGERVGNLAVVARSPEESKAIFSQLSVLSRSEISNPPTFGARIVSLILNDAKLFELWKQDIATMAHRIASRFRMNQTLQSITFAQIDMRKALYDLLTNKFKTPGKWDHILSQIGMSVNSLQAEASAELCTPGFPLLGASFVVLSLF
jgi:aspartate aminotransferase